MRNPQKKRAKAYYCVPSICSGKVHMYLQKRNIHVAGDVVRYVNMYMYICYVQSFIR